MKTHELIDDLTTKLKPFDRAEGTLRFMAKWFAAAAAAVFLALLVLPLKQGIAAQMADPRFSFDTLIWLAGAAGAAVIVRRSAIPGMLTRNDQRIMLVALGALLLTIALRFPHSFSELSADARTEMNADRGRCGPIVFGFGLLWSVALMLWVRRLAPTRLALSGAWIAISAGCLACFAVRFFCLYENPVHVLIWHGFPVALLAFFGARLGARVLKW